VNAVTSTGNTPGIGAATVLDGLVADFAGGSTGNADMDTVIAALGTMTRISRSPMPSPDVAADDGGMTSSPSPTCAV